MSDFTDEETETERLNNLLEVKVFVRGRSGISTQVIWPQSLHSYLLTSYLGR